MKKIVVLVSLFFTVLIGQEIGKPFVQMGHSGWVNSVAFSPNGKIFASGSVDGTIRLWHSENKKLLKILRVGKYIAHIEFSPNGNFLVSSNYDDNEIIIWNIIQGKILKKIKSFIGNEAITFSPNGNTLAIGGNKVIQLYNYKTFKLKKINIARSKKILFNKNGNLLFIADWDLNIKIFDIQNNRLLKTLKVIKPSINSLTHITSISFHQNSNILAFSDNHGVIKLWDIKTGRIVKILKDDGVNIESISFSPNGKFLVSASSNKVNNLRLWDVKTGKLIKILKGHNHYVNSIDFSPNGKTFITGSNDNTIKLWDIYRKKLIKTF